LYFANLFGRKISKVVFIRSGVVSGGNCYRANIFEKPEERVLPSTLTRDISKLIRQFHQLPSRTANRITTVKKNPHESMDLFYIDEPDARGYD
jgi:hypothetical protein